MPLNWMKIEVQRMSKSPCLCLVSAWVFCKIFRRYPLPLASLSMAQALQVPRSFGFPAKELTSIRAAHWRQLSLPLEAAREPNKLIEFPARSPSRSQDIHRPGCWRHASECFHSSACRKHGHRLQEAGWWLLVLHCHLVTGSVICRPEGQLFNFLRCSYAVSGSRVQSSLHFKDVAIRTCLSCGCST